MNPGDAVLWNQFHSVWLDVELWVGLRSFHQVQNGVEEQIFLHSDNPRTGSYFGYTQSKQSITINSFHPLTTSFSLMNHKSDLPLHREGRMPIVVVTMLTSTSTSTTAAAVEPTTISSPATKAFRLLIEMTRRVFRLPAMKNVSSLHYITFLLDTGWIRTTKTIHSNKSQSQGLQPQYQHQYQHSRVIKIKE